MNIFKNKQAVYGTEFIKKYQIREFDQQNRLIKSGFTWAEYNRNFGFIFMFIPLVALIAIWAILAGTTNIGFFKFVYFVVVIIIWIKASRMAAAIRQMDYISLIFHADGSISRTGKKGMFSLKKEPADPYNLPNSHHDIVSIEMKRITPAFALIQFTFNTGETLPVNTALYDNDYVGGILTAQLNTALEEIRRGSSPQTTAENVMDMVMNDMQKLNDDDDLIE